MLVPGDEWGSESPWLVSAARTLSAGKPVVAVLVDGGPVALSEALACAAEGWPVLVLTGSGRSADQLADYAAGGSMPDLQIPRSAIHVARVATGTSSIAEALGRLLGRPAEPPTPAPNGPPTADHYPALYVAASEAAKRGQTLHRRLSFAEITLTTIGLAIVLVMSLVQPIVGFDRELQTPLTVTISALAFLAALVLKFLGRASGFDADWYNGRALAETVKSLSWRFMMRARPYDAADSDRRFTTDLAGLTAPRPSVPPSHRSTAAPAAAAIGAHALRPGSRPGGPAQLLRRLPTVRPS